MVDSVDEFIAAYPIFGMCSRGTLDDFLVTGRMGTAKPADTLTYLGEAKPPVFLIKNGLASLSCIHPDSAERQIEDLLKGPTLYCSTLSPSGISGVELACVSAFSYIRWPLEQFTKLLLKEPKFAYSFYQCQLMRQTIERNRSAQMRSLSLEAQLAHLMWCMADLAPKGSPRVLSIRMPQHVVASFLRMSREEVSRKKKYLEEARFIVGLKNGGYELSPNMPMLFESLALEQHGNPWHLDLFKNWLPSHL